jgi:hypothetical protein
MSLNDIQLNQVAIAGLYSRTLVENSTTQIPKDIAKTEKTENASVTPVLKFLGNNRSNIAILVESDVPFLPDDQLQFLTRMLSACKLSLEDVAIVNCINKNVSLSILQASLRPVKILMLGVEPSSINLPFNFPHFKSQSHAGCTYLCAPSLYELGMETADAKMLKTKLWVSLKEIFGI